MYGWNSVTSSSESNLCTVALIERQRQSQKLKNREKNKTGKVTEKQ